MLCQVISALVALTLCAVFSAPAIAATVSHWPYAGNNHKKASWPSSDYRSVPAPSFILMQPTPNLLKYLPRATPAPQSIKRLPNGRILLPCWDSTKNYYPNPCR